MSAAVSIAVRCIKIADDVCAPVLATMRREGWPPDLRAIVLAAIARLFQDEADKALLASRDTLPGPPTDRA
jgi:hypothetical protein